jgi:hypothetical protein
MKKPPMRWLFCVWGRRGEWKIEKWKMVCEKWKGL